MVAFQRPKGNRRQLEGKRQWLGVTVRSHSCKTNQETSIIRNVGASFLKVLRPSMCGPWEKFLVHMQTVLCLDVAHQTERSLNMASRAWLSEEQADKHMSPKNWMLWHAVACCGMLPNPYVQLQKTGAAAFCGMLRHAAAAHACLRLLEPQLP